MSLIDNERTKLLANALDRASTACFTVGILTPIAGYLYNVADFGSTLDWRRLLITVAGWFVAALALHLMARSILGRLKP